VVRAVEDPAPRRPVVLGRSAGPVVDLGGDLGDDLVPVPAEFDGAALDGTELEGDEDFDDLDDPDGVLAGRSGRAAARGGQAHLRHDEDLDLLGDVDPGLDQDLDLDVPADVPAVSGDGRSAEGRVPAAGEARR
jgi:hypothetical protein